MPNIKTLLLLLVLTLLSSIIFSQDTTSTIQGYVINKISSEPLALATIARNEENWISTDTNGHFSFPLSVLKKGDEISFSYSGYETFTIAYKDIIKNRNLKALYIPMEIKQLEEIKFVSKYSIEYILLRQLIKHKHLYGFHNTENYFTKVFNSTEIDIPNLDSSFFKFIKNVKSLDFFTKNIDTLKETGESFLPIYLSESEYDWYVQVNPFIERKYIIARKEQFIDKESILTSFFHFYKTIDIYQNHIYIFDKNFISPIADNAFRHYTYKLIDTQITNEGRIIQMQFAPRRAGGDFFQGRLWYLDSYYVVKKIILQQPKTTSLNFIKNFTITQEFIPIQKKWLLSKEYFFSDVIPFEEKSNINFFLKINSIFTSYSYNQDSTSKTLTHNKNHSEILFAKDFKDKNDDYWLNHRPYVLSDRKKIIYKLVDSLKNVPVYKNTVNALEVLVTGFYHISPKLLIGRWFSVIAFNPYEKIRTNLFLASSDFFSKKFYFQTYLGYATEDKQFKGGIATKYYYNRVNWSYIYADITRDYSNLLTPEGEINNINNLFARIIRKDNNYFPFNFSDIVLARTGFYHSLFHGFGIGLSTRYTAMKPLTTLPTQDKIISKTSADSYFEDFKIQVHLHYAHLESFFQNKLNIGSLPSYYPKIDLYYTKSFKNVINSSTDYHKILLSINQNVDLPYWGNIKATLNIGSTLGEQVPYYYLDAPSGNDFLNYEHNFFNMMRSYEYIFDRYLTFMYEENFGITLLQWIPFIKKLNWHQIINFKLAYGTLSSTNASFNKVEQFNFKSNTSELPYMEAGVAIGNILKILRISWVWRLTHQLEGKEFFTNQLPMISAHITF